MAEPILVPLARRLLWVGIALVVVVYGVAGYMLLEGWGFFDALYMTVTTMTTGVTVRMAQDPGIVDLFDEGSGARRSIEVEERVIAPGSGLAGRAVRDAPEGG